MTATQQQIAHHWLAVMRDIPNWQGINWGCDQRGFKYWKDDALLDWASSELGVWDVDADTYINGVMLTIDSDYYMGYCLEIVERDTSVVSYMAVAVYHGFGKDGSIDHDYVSYPPVCGTFFDRTLAADQIAVTRWACTAIYSMFDTYASRDR